MVVFKLKIEFFKRSLLFILLCSSFSIFSQSFQSTSIPLVKEVFNGKSIFVDFDNDGNLDLLVSGSEDFFTIKTRIYKNVGLGNFEEMAQLPGIFYGDVDATDYDGDGFIDILLVGATNSLGAPIGTKFYKNKGLFTFQEVSNGLPNLRSGIVKFGDYDNDGDADIWLDGIVASERIHEIYRNDAGQFAAIGLNIKYGDQGNIAWQDYDLDGDLDFVFFSNLNPIAIYKNLGDDLFVPFYIEHSGSSITNIDWGDYNNDGKPDLVLLGAHRNSQMAEVLILKNTGNDNFENLVVGTIEGSPYSYGNLNFVDVDSNGDLDIVNPFVIFF